MSMHCETVYAICTCSVVKTYSREQIHFRAEHRKRKTSTADHTRALFADDLEECWTRRVICSEE